MADLKTFPIKTRAGERFENVFLLVEAVTRRGRLAKAVALFPEDTKKQLRWLLADVDKTTVGQGDWMALEDGVRNAGCADLLMGKTAVLERLLVRLLGLARLRLGFLEVLPWLYQRVLQGGQ